WSKEMRDGVTAARDAGVNVAFLGSTAGFRQVRFEPSSLGTERHVVNFRIARDDPLFHVDDSRVTVDWRAPPVNRPESELNDVEYACNIPRTVDMVVADASSWLFAGTGLRDGDRLSNVVGIEYDGVAPGAPTPSSIQIVARSSTTCRGRPAFAD